jgi:hypothetical protein
MEGAGQAGVPGDTAPGDEIPLEEAELGAMRAADLLRRALSDEGEAREQLREVLEHLSTLQGQLCEWHELHHILHELLTAFSSFYAQLRALGPSGAGSTEGRALLRGWRPCQGGVDRLRDFESGAQHLQRFFQGEGATASQPDWGARIAALRHEMEDRLREDRWSTPGLIDVADEFHHACMAYLGLADRELGRAVTHVQRLCAHLAGGLS